MDIPPGFAIPFHYYQEFIRRNNLEMRISSAVEEDKFVHDPKYRKARLAEIRGWIQAGTHDEAFRVMVLRKAHAEFPGQALFARSSTNAEDLPNFSGAGLYTTVPNVRTDEQLMDAIKTVWASVWNYEAYEARESFGMSHFAVYPAVLIQVGINADSAGVAITTDPFNSGSEAGDANGPFHAPSTESASSAAPANRTRPDSIATDSVYINAKRGLGTKVVEGSRVAEQVIYHPGSGSIQVLTRSNDDSMLQFDPRGGLKEIKIEPERQVLTDDMVKGLAAAALRIKTVFGGRDQDIEWVYRAGRLYIVQSRPYVTGAEK
ncbi:MAG TPA: PEP/pyruvate-binding domain-containing protein [Blastocatellia bacterium]